MTEAREKIAEAVVAECSYIQPTLRNEAQAHLRAMMRLAIQEYEAALSEAGWVVVPKRPTMEMEEAGGKELPPHKGASTNGHHASHVYRAMISAATPPVKGGE